MNKGKLFHISASFYARDEDPPNVARGLVRFWTPEAIQEVTEAVSAAERSSFLVLHATTAIPRTYLVCAIINKRLGFWLSFVKLSRDDIYRFSAMYDTKQKPNYLTGNDDVPIIAVANPNHLREMLFFVAVSRPRYNQHKRE
ncbi:hypothetical protein GN958_ATG21238 [Phytophthora infestans]|uniref:Uncharacterized protein n=1 Tax=Phytophthora infestans TaxID=4787 RepID=A0A8S9TUC9_PHYIN|nr:hypothetical protein GN958_ATG21238 [Phytophthora infestans]